MKTILTGVLALLALAIGSLHFALDFAVFRGQIFVPPPPVPRPPPSGGPPPPSFPLDLPLSELFLLNLAVYAVLAILLLAAIRARSLVRGGVDVLLILATLFTLWGWNNFRRPNPMGLATWAVSLEIALLVVAVLHIAVVSRQTAAAPPP